jgi:hypothetical protein
MNEEQWLNATDPTPVLRFLQGTGKASDRRLLLFGAACCRRLLAHFPDGTIRRAAECGEHHADGRGTAEERFEAGRASAPKHLPRRGLPRALTGTQPALAGGTWMGLVDAPWPVPPDRRGAEGLAVRAAHFLVTACGARPGSPVAQAARRAVGAVGVAANDRYEVLRCPAGEEVRVARATWRAAQAAQAAEQRAQVALLRDIFATPFRPRPALAPDLLTPDVLDQARTAYEERQLPSGHLDPARLAALAAALEESGRTDAGLLSHLRGEGPHVRGCFVVDAVLGMEGACRTKP